MYQVVLPKKDFYSAREWRNYLSQYNYNLKMTGPSMPYPWFEGDENLYLIQKYCKLAANHGLFFIRIIIGLLVMPMIESQSINLFLLPEMLLRRCNYSH